MIRLENTEVIGWEAAIRGMRNPMNSWGLSDSSFDCTDMDCRVCRYFDKATTECNVGPLATYILGHKDHDLAMKLAKGGPVHAKYRRMIQVYVDITAPLYWWKEFDTYKVGTVTNSCSTMHKIHEKEFTLDDFSHDNLYGLNWDIPEEEKDKWLDDNCARIHIDGEHRLTPLYMLDVIVQALNFFRDRFIQTGDKRYWWQMIQLLPSSYNQRRTVMLSYEVLAHIHPDRKYHKLDEWRTFCNWIEKLPYSEIITLKEG